MYFHTSTQLLSESGAAQLHGRLELLATLRRGLEALRPEWKYKMPSTGAGVDAAVQPPVGSTDPPRRGRPPMSGAALGLPKWWLPLHDEQLAQV